MWPCFLLLLAALASRAAGQPSPTANVSTWAELFAAVQGNFTSIRVVSHVSYANAPDGINVTNVPLSVFGDAAACAASAAALNKSDFSADPQSFSACTLDAAATWRHFALYPSSGAPVDNTQGVSFSDLRCVLCAPRPSPRHPPPLRSFINGVGVNAVDNTGWLSIGGTRARFRRRLRRCTRSRAAPRRHRRHQHVLRELHVVQLHQQYRARRGSSLLWGRRLAKREPELRMGRGACQHRGLQLCVARGARRSALPLPAPFPRTGRFVWRACCAPAARAQRR